MKSKELLYRIDNSMGKLCRNLALFSCLALSAMIIIIFIHVILRYIFQSPLLGAVEMVEILMVVLASFAILYTASIRGHVNADVLVSRFSRNTRAVLNIIALSVGIVIFALMAWQGITAGIYSVGKNETTSLLFIPISPFRFLLALGFILLCIILFIQALHPSKTEEKQKEEETWNQSGLE